MTRVVPRGILSAAGREGYQMTWASTRTPTPPPGRGAAATRSWRLSSSSAIGAKASVTEVSRSMPALKLEPVPTACEPVGAWAEIHDSTAANVPDALHNRSRSTRSSVAGAESGAVNSPLGAVVTDRHPGAGSTRARRCSAALLAVDRWGSGTPVVCGGSKPSHARGAVRDSAASGHAARDDDLSDGAVAS